MCLFVCAGDRLKLTRSKSFRENRKDPEGGKPDKHLNQNHGSLNDIPEVGQLKAL